LVSSVTRTEKTRAVAAVLAVGVNWRVVYVSNYPEGGNEPQQAVAVES
jgi:hypothetical protein